MSIQTAANNREELLQALHGNLTKEELDEAGLDHCVPVLAHNKCGSVTLLPPKTQGRLVGLLRRSRAMKFSGGYLTYPHVVAVVIPHVYDREAGEVTLWMCDNLYTVPKPICGRVVVPLNKGKQFVLLRPNYSIPLSDGIKGVARAFSVVYEQNGINCSPDMSPFSLFLTWEQEIGQQAHNYLPADPVVIPIQRQALRSLLATPRLLDQVTARTQSNRYAAPALPGAFCPECGRAGEHAASCLQAFT
jgi:hypothetical protein